MTATTANGSCGSCAAMSERISTLTHPGGTTQASSCDNCRPPSGAQKAARTRRQVCFTSETFPNNPVPPRPHRRPLRASTLRSSSEGSTVVQPPREVTAEDEDASTDDGSHHERNRLSCWEEPLE